MSYFVREIKDMEDVMTVLELARLFHQENRPELLFEDAHLVAYGDTILRDTSRSRANCFICFKDEKPIGFLVATCSDYMFSRQLSARQELIYLHPDFRGLTPFRKLLKALDEWAALCGAVEVYTGVSVHEPDKAEKISRLLERSGYPMNGYYHMKGVTK